MTKNVVQLVQRRMSGSDRRDQILDVARQIVLEDGFAAVTMKRLAENAGITRTVIYQQFGDLPSALVALVEREIARETASYLQSVATHSGGGVAQFVGVMADLLNAAEANPSAWRLFLMPPEGGPAELYERFAEGRELVRGLLGESFKAAVKEGVMVLFDQDFELGVRSIYVVAENLLRLFLEDPKKYTRERVLAQVRVLSEALFRDTDAANAQVGS